MDLKLDGCVGALEDANCLSRFSIGSLTGPGTTDTRCKRPFPTRPKLAADASAIRVVWNGDQATA